MENEGIGEEKRGAKRISKQMSIQYCLDLDPMFQKWDMSSIINIGEKGVKFTVNGKLNPGITIYMRIKLPLKPFEWLKLNGKLVSSEELKTKKDKIVSGTSVARVEFLELEENQKSLLQEYVLWFLSKDGGIK